MSAPRFIIGQSTANGFTGFSDGDLFSKNGELFRLCSGRYGWTLRLVAEDGTTDFRTPPLDGWTEIPSAFELIEKLNAAVI